MYLDSKRLQIKFTSGLSRDVTHNTYYGWVLYAWFSHDAMVNLPVVEWDRIYPESNKFATSARGTKLQVA